MANSIPVEIEVLQAKREIIQSINQIGTNHKLPSFMTIMIVQQIVSESQLSLMENTLTSVSSKEKEDESGIEPDSIE